ncbi:ETC complex I subunit [Tropicimonas sp.]|uniref:ETC complex I subunit n=1 Tax=Tropicimonas sp. TaxID=2067044 RepID=UPI003A8AC72F
MRARIYQPARNAMQSGMGKTKLWLLEIAPSEPREIDPLTGWVGSADTASQIRMRFETREAAMDYAREHGIAYTLLESNKRKPVIRPRGYGENFATNRKAPWTH